MDPGIGFHRPRPALSSMATFLILSVLIVGSITIGKSGSVNAQTQSSNPVCSYQTGVASGALSTDGKFMAEGTNGVLFFLSIQSNSTFFQYPCVSQWSYSSNNEIFGPVAISGNDQYVLAEGTVCTQNSCPPTCTDTSVPQVGTYQSFCKDIYLFSVASSTPLWVYRTAWAPLSISISNDGQFIVVGMNSGYLYLFSRSSSTPVWRYAAGGCDSQLHCNGVSAVISNDGQYIAAVTDYDSYGTGGLNAYLFSTVNQQLIWRSPLGQHFDCNSEVALSGDGQYVAASSGLGVQLYSRTSSSPIQTYLQNASVTSIAMSGKGDHIVAGSSGSRYCSGSVSYGHIAEAYLFSSSSPNALQQYALGPYDNGPWVALSADGNYVAAGNTNVLLFSSGNTSPIINYTKSFRNYGVQLSSDGRYLLEEDSSSVNLFQQGGVTATSSTTTTTTTTTTSIATSAVTKYISLSGWKTTKNGGYSSPGTTEFVSGNLIVGYVNVTNIASSNVYFIHDTFRITPTGEKQISVAGTTLLYPARTQTETIEDWTVPGNAAIGWYSFLIDYKVATDISGQQVLQQGEVTMPNFYCVKSSATTACPTPSVSNTTKITLQGFTLRKVGGVTFRVDTMQLNDSASATASGISLHIPSTTSTLFANYLKIGSFAFGLDGTIVKASDGERDTVSGDSANQGDYLMKGTAVVGVQIDSLPSWQVNSAFVIDISSRVTNFVVDKVQDAVQQAISAGGEALIVTLNPQLLCGIVPVSAVVGNTPCGGSLVVVAASPVNLLVISPSGRMIGTAANGTQVNQLSGAWYSGKSVEPQIVWITQPEQGKYNATMTGTGTGNVGYAIASFTNAGALVNSFSSTVSQGQVLTSSISLSGGSLDVKPPALISSQNVGQQSFISGPTQLAIPIVLGAVIVAGLVLGLRRRRKASAA